METVFNITVSLYDNVQGASTYITSENYILYPDGSGEIDTVELSLAQS